MSADDPQQKNDSLYMLVLVGAGASFDCDLDGGGPGDRMPLVTGLFESNPLLNDYASLRSMANDLNEEIKDPDFAGSVEQFLRRMLASPREFERAQARLIPFYLQDRIAEMSARWEPHSGNYGRLVN